MVYDRDGARLFEGALDEGALERVDEALSSLPTDRPGVRLAELAALRPLLAVDGPVGRIAAGILGPESRPCNGSVSAALWLAKVDRKSLRQ